MSIATHIKEHAILGTSVFNPAAVAITGGTINGTVIGGTTPAAITGTTITGTVLTMDKLSTSATAGEGAAVAAGAATTNVNMISGTQTWNNAAVTFTAAKLDVTDTASNAASLLLDLKIGGATKWSFGKTAMTMPGYSTINMTNGTVIATDGNPRYSIDYGLNYILASASRGFGWTGDATTGGGTKDTALNRSAAGVVEVNNGTIGTWRDMKMRTLILDKTITAPGTTGAQTINKSSGRVNFAAAATSLVVTNSLVDANSIITGNIATADATAADPKIVAAAGSFTITLGVAPTAETAFDFRLTN